MKEVGGEWGKGCAPSGLGKFQKLLHNSYTYTPLTRIQSHGHTSPQGQPEGVGFFCAWPHALPKFLVPWEGREEVTGKAPFLLIQAAHLSLAKVLA